MCGINGIAFTRSSGKQVHVDLLTRMRDVITHRGPDDAGVFIDGGIGLAMRRLSIVDVAGGHQPMKNETGRVHIVYNGEIYNHADYRQELEERGHVYQTHCDTETILHLFEVYGPDCVSFLRGMFAFAIWDQDKQELFIARDRLGVKPLYYTHTGDGALYFGSEIKALLATGDIRPELNYKALPDYLANHSTSGEDTLFLGVKRLLPGHWLKWRDGRIQIQKYWDISFAGQDQNESRSEAEYTDAWRELFRTSVRLRLMADVPLGMFLSGGIDSSAIAAMMSQMVTEPIKTFSVAFAEREANELEYARMIARQFKTDHHEVVVSAEEFFASLPKLIWHEDEPIAHPASIPLYFVSRLAQQHVKVVLTGEGSDELLAGYYRYRKTVYNLALGAKYQRFTTPALRGGVKRIVESFAGGSSVGRKLTRTFLCNPADIESLYFDNFAVFPKAMQRDLLSSITVEQVGDLDPYVHVRELVATTDARNLLDQLLYVDTKTYLHELLMKQDQMSMAASIESRVPFLDHKLVEFTAAMPQRFKLRGLTTKYILRQSMKGILPDAIISRPKMGFPVPLGTWFRDQFRPVVDEYVLGDRALSRGLFNADFIRRLIAQHQAGHNHAERIWSLINVEMWMRQFIDGERVANTDFEVAETVSR